jgi:hypothetical protein
MKLARRVVKFPGADRHSESFQNDQSGADTHFRPEKYLGRTSPLVPSYSMPTRAGVDRRLKVRIEENHQ